MKKNLFALLMLLMLAIACLGLAEGEVIGGADAQTEIVIEETAEDVVLGSAYDGAITVTRSEIEDEYDQMLASYISYYAQYGYTLDEYDTELQLAVAQETVYSKLSERIAMHFAEQNGFALTEEMEAEILANAEATMDSVREYYESYLAYYGYEGEELEKIVEEEIAASGYSLEYLVHTGELSAALEHIYELFTADVTVTDEEVQAAFDAKVEEAKATYEDLDEFVSAYIAGDDILYTPEGMRLMQVIYIVSEENEATPDEAADPADLTGLAKANAVKALLDGGADFEQTMFAYNEEGTTEEEMLAGYAVSADCTSYGEEFLAAAMALENIGDVSDVVSTSYGHFIIRYAADLTAGAVSIEGREETEAAEALENKKNDAYSEGVNTMLADAAIVMNDMSCLYHVYVAEVIEATIAYATVENETALTDMPAGDTVGTLAAGAALDVLGYIGVDNENYAFVSVMGTDAKGYVNESALVAIEEETATATDNAALFTAVAVEGKNPTFTIAMNDGSLIYGELYPAIAPESVGNFVALANENFYDGVIFHRVIAGFMIQGGDPTGTGTGGPGYAIKGEFSSNGVENDLSHTRGVLSMARSSALDSAGSQFFIMHADSDYLDGDYAAFGMVLGGIETVDVIASQPTNSNDRPMTDQTMRTVYVETYGQTYEFTKLDD